MPLRETLSGYWRSFQGELFPALEEELGPLGERYRNLVTVLELARVEAFVKDWPGLVGRPRADRAALARGFVAKAVFNIAQTSMLIERLRLDKALRRLCVDAPRGGSERGDVLAGLWRVRGERAAGPPARSGDCQDPRRAPGGPHLA